jgi:hypothetical protein
MAYVGIFQLFIASGCLRVCTVPSQVGLCKIEVPSADKETSYRKQVKENYMVWVRERTIPTERPPLVGEVIANFYG